MPPMTVNLGRNAAPSPEPHPGHKPDVIGTQEGLHRQILDLENDLPGYGRIGVGREGGSLGEYMAIFYNTERLKPLEQSHFWLSDTPQTISSASWGTRFRGWQPGFASRIFRTAKPFIWSTRIWITNPRFPGRRALNSLSTK